MYGQYLEEKVYKLESIICSNCREISMSSEGFVISNKSFWVVGCPKCMKLRGVELTRYQCPSCESSVDEEHEMTFYFDKNDDCVGCEDCIEVLKDGQEDELPEDVVTGRWEYEYF